MPALAIILNPSHMWKGHSAAEVFSWVPMVTLNILHMEVILGDSALCCSYTASNIWKSEYWFCDIEKPGYIVEWKEATGVGLRFCLYVCEPWLK